MSVKLIALVWTEANKYKWRGCLWDEVVERERDIVERVPHTTQTLSGFIYSIRLNRIEEIKLMQNFL